MDIFFWGFVLVGLGLLSVITLLQRQSKRDKLRQQRELREKRELDRKSAPCPECAEPILVEAKRCKYCQADVANHMEPFRVKLLEQQDDSRFSAAVAQMSSGRTAEVLGWVLAAGVFGLLGFLIALGPDPLSLLTLGVVLVLGVVMAVNGRRLRNKAAADLAELDSGDNP
jgi:hypothetical protein